MFKLTCLFSVLFVSHLSAATIKIECKSITDFKSEVSIQIDMDRKLVLTPNSDLPWLPIKVTDEYIKWIYPPNKFTIHGVSVLERESLLLVSSVITKLAFDPDLTETGFEISGPISYMYQCSRGI